MRKVKTEEKKKVTSKNLTKSGTKVSTTEGKKKPEAQAKSKKTSTVKKTSEVKKNKNDLNGLIVHGMQEKKALDITILDLTNIKNSVANYFILCSATSDTQVGAISDSIEEQIHKAIKQNPWRKEGHENKEWVLLDYVDVVAHVFKKDRRQFYSLEELWGDATITHVE